jgi:hypothetical protein
MAFNFRPKTAKQILDKKKLLGQEAARVHNYIMSEYGAGIILDPTKNNFKDIKIPRSVEQKVNIAGIKKALVASLISIDELDIKFGNGSGAGGSKMDASATAKQENATRFVCEKFIETGRMPAVVDISKIYPDVDDEWEETFAKQASSLKKWLSGKKKYNYSRDTGIMPIVENIALQKCGVRTKDNWNPADIYIVKQTEEKQIVKQLKSIGGLETDKELKLDRLNEYMRELFVKRHLVGISLKKLGRVVRLEETNVKKIEPVKDISIVKDSIKLDLDLNDSDEFVTGEMAFSINVKGNNVNVQIRAFSGGERESTQMDMTETGAAAKLGKVSSIVAIDPYIKKLGLKRRMGSDLPRVGMWTSGEINRYVTEYHRLRDVPIGGSKIYWGKNKWETSLRRAIQIEHDNPRTASQLSTKLQCFEWVKIFQYMDRKMLLDEFLTILYYGAKKQYDTAGPFLKIS